RLHRLFMWSSLGLSHAEMTGVGFLPSGLSTTLNFGLSASSWARAATQRAMPPDAYRRSEDTRPMRVPSARAAETASTITAIAAMRRACMDPLCLVIQARREVLARGHPARRHCRGAAERRQGSEGALREGRVAAGGKAVPRRDRGVRDGVRARAASERALQHRALLREPGRVVAVRGLLRALPRRS